VLILNIYFHITIEQNGHIAYLHRIWS